MSRAVVVDVSKWTDKTTKAIASLDKLAIDISLIVSMAIIKEIAEDLAKESAARAPVETSLLESSHKTSIKTNSSNDVTGIVYLKGSGPASKTSQRSKNVQDYVLAMHEGRYRLGKLSLEKQASSGVMIGPKFLERALYDNIYKYNQMIVDGIAKAFRKGVG